MNDDPENDVALWRAWAVLIALAMCFNIALAAGLWAGFETVWSGVR